MTRLKAIFTSIAAIVVALVAGYIVTNNRKLKDLELELKRKDINAKVQLLEKQIDLRIAKRTNLVSDLINLDFYRKRNGTGSTPRSGSEL